MFNFIRDALVNVMWKNLKTFDDSHKCDGGETISIKGSAENGKATFVITRAKEDGYKCNYEDKTIGII